MWQYYVCFIRSDVCITWCTLFMVLYLCCMFQYRLLAVIYLHISICTCAPSLLQNLTESHYHRAFIPFSEYLWNDLADYVFNGVGLVHFNRRNKIFFIGLSCLFHFCFLLFSLYLLSFHELELWDWGFETHSVQITLCKTCIADLFLISNSSNADGK